MTASEWKMKEFNTESRVGIGDGRAVGMSIWRLGDMQDEKAFLRRVEKSALSSFVQNSRMVFARGHMSVEASPTTQTQGPERY
ncbi:hypothetical protein EVAR_92369_1 [Eumeta japonica]|uniref:Uncharacterized protein n=1 Tax=Eumeta variegata TaxID=151549 RepID=A0A4C1TLQ3_EUMVA|nr:hypothetical protein EVAR_92369_1 [Eumeta japonica]